VRWKLIVIVVYRYLLGGELEREKLDKYLSLKENRTDDDVKALVQAVSLVLRGGCKNDVSISELQKELQQVGLPREHGVMLRRPYEKYSSVLRQRLKNQTLSVGKVQTIRYRVDYVVARSTTQVKRRVFFFFFFSFFFLFRRMRKKRKDS
jgi:hypothetical protein